MRLVCVSLVTLSKRVHHINAVQVLVIGQLEEVIPPRQKYRWGVHQRHVNMFFFLSRELFFA